MKKSAFKKIIAVSLAFATLMFAGCQKDELVNEENPSESISQQGETDDLSDKLPVMDNTIDLRTKELNMEFNIFEDYEISVPYPTALGTVYVVREFLTEKTLTYLFVATQDDVKYEMVTDMGQKSTTYTIHTENVDDEPGEEILLAIDAGSTFGRGLWIAGVYKITEKGIESIEMDESGYNVTAEKPFKFIITNEYTDLQKTVDADNQSYLFEDDGTPAPYATEHCSLGVWDIHPEDVDEDGDYEIVIREWSDISKEVADKNVDMETVYEYDREKNKFVVTETSLMLTDEDEDIYENNNCYVYCDINNDGTDELITRKWVKRYDPVDIYKYEQKVFTFENEKLVYLGELEDNNGYYYCRNGYLIEAGVRTSKIWYNAYKLEDNKIAKVDSGDNISIDYENELYERLGEEIEWICY